MNIQKISSAKLKDISKLKLKKYREETGLFLIESEKILLEALNSNWKVREIFITKDNFHLIDKLKNLLSIGNFKLYELSEKEFKKLSNEITPSGVAATVEIKKFNLNAIFDQKIRVVPVFEKISDPGNLGTIIRTADWFGFNTLVLSEKSVELTNPKVVRASMGSIFHLKIFEEVELKTFINHARKNNYKIYGTTTSGKSLHYYNLDDQFILIFGNESHGVSEEILKLCDDHLAIPSYGSAESLNLAISTSIFFYELKKLNQK